MASKSLFRSTRTKSAVLALSMLGILAYGCSDSSGSGGNPTKPEDTPAPLPEPTPGPQKTRSPECTEEEAEGYLRIDGRCYNAVYITSTPTDGGFQVSQLDDPHSFSPIAAFIPKTEFLTGLWISPWTAQHQNLPIPPDDPHIALESFDYSQVPALSYNYEVHSHCSADLYAVRDHLNSPETMVMPIISGRKGCHNKGARGPDGNRSNTPCSMENVIASYHNPDYGFAAIDTNCHDTNCQIGSILSETAAEFVAKPSALLRITHDLHGAHLAEDTPVWTGLARFGGGLYAGDWGSGSHDSGRCPDSWSTPKADISATAALLSSSEPTASGTFSAKILSCSSQASLFCMAVRPDAIAHPGREPR